MSALTIVPPPMPAFSMGDIERVANAIAKGGLFGSKDPYAVLTLCLLAQAEGQHPAVVFRDYHIISGKPAKKADAMLRDFITGGGKVEWHTLTNECADATFSHPAGGSARIDWTMARAKAAGLATAMWAKYPRQMLRSRVISEGVRTIYPGATSGLYVPEEVQGFDDQPERPAQITPEPIQQDQAPNTATTTRRSPPLKGPIKTRAEIRSACGDLVRDLHGCSDHEMLRVVLDINEPLIGQVEDECEFFWLGDGADFIGLKAEIEAAKVRMMNAEGEVLVDLMQAG